MPYIAPEIILEAKQIDLLTYLRHHEPDELVKLSDRVYTTRRHDSLKISNGKWMWWSQGIGGNNAIDYLVKVKRMRFIEAVKTVLGHPSIPKQTYQNTEKKVKDRPLLLPEKSKSTDIIFEYLFKRGIDEEIINFCIQNNLIFESLPYHNVVFIGSDEKNVPTYAAYRSTNSEKIMGDCSGSKKQYSFRLTNEESDEIHLFECAIDLLSYATLYKHSGGNWRDLTLISLAGVYLPRKQITDSKIPIALEYFLKTNPDIKRIILHLDNDNVGRYATKALQIILSGRYEVVDNPPPVGKDFNDFLCIKSKIKNKNERSF